MIFDSDWEFLADPYVRSQLGGNCNMNVSTIGPIDRSFDKHKYGPILPIEPHQVVPVRRSVMMRAAFRCLAVTLILISALAVQVLLQHDNLGNGEWSLDKLPNPNDTDHLVFETVHSLLQHWPNTRMRNGGPRRVLLFLIHSNRLFKAITSCREEFRRGHFCTMGPRGMKYHRALNGLLLILNIHIASVELSLAVSSELKNAGISRLQQLDHSKSSILTVAVLQSFPMVHWTLKTLLYGVTQALWTPYSTKDNGLRIFANGERILV